MGPKGREVFQTILTTTRAEHTCWIGCSGFGMAYTFTMPFGDAHPAFFIVAMMWTGGFLLHAQALLAPSKYIYKIKLNENFVFVDGIFAALGWFSFYASKVGL